MCIRDSHCSTRWPSFMPERICASCLRSESGFTPCRLIIVPHTSNHSSPPPKRLTTACRKDPVSYTHLIEVPAKVNSTLSYSEKPDDFQLKNKIADLLAANGFNEIMNNSLTKASYYEHLETYRPEETVMLFNPLSSDLSAMRQSLLFGGLETIAYNINRKNSNLRLFEFGKAYTFHKKEGENHLKQYKEEDKLALFITGDKIQASWNSKEQKTDFFNLKSYAEMILIRLGFKTEMLTLEECSADIYRRCV